MSATSAPTTNPVLEFQRRKRTRSNLSVFTLPTSLAKRPHIEELAESQSSSAQTKLPSETDTSSSSASSDAESLDYASDVESEDLEGIQEVEDGDIEVTSESELGDEDEDEETSSSSSSSSSSGSLSASPSPSPTTQGGLGNFIGASTRAAAVPSLFTATGGHSIPSRPASSLSSRLQAFLPAMRSANAELEKERDKGTLAQKNIEHTAGTDESPEGYIEMNLGLGVLEERDPNDSNSDSDTSSDGNSSITEPSDRAEESGQKAASHKPKGERDILGKLTGHPKMSKPGIEVVDVS